ncbi:hypothetical protein AXG93_1923s1380 [Marchantia polymorpha subsp. ruderalis]|uniref:FHA domain-containing protein n=1 Tax=Marchantia polymorpha subsp. ruderalis TaxID=1480154 RepID=A0A176VDW6_MARPO|nr:hypothetical protein AXG93_1923s1380 [Marchantia polymorpha subsp. ruderalis]
MKGRKEMVPFLTVLKGDEVLDSINLEGRDTLVMGRHHSCDLVVSHASSSRRHLEIQIISSTRDVILTDLGSVHGTWVHGNRLGIMAPVVVHGSATFQLAASTRVYRIDWQPGPVDSDAEAGQSTESIHSSIEAAPQELPSHAPGRRQSGHQKRPVSENQQEFSSKSNSAGGGGGLQSRGGGVVRELDFLKHREGLRSPAREALRWIESCMVRLPNWIHVQKSSETLPAGATPPPSPSRPFPHHAGPMSPTSDDHILECAMLFDMTTHYGKVALLTRDTALRIKAMSEGLLSESAVEFVESLLSPYSNRFLWAGSTAHGKTWVDSPLHSPVSYPGEPTRPKALAQITHPVDELRHHISAQPRGLQVVVSQ